MYNAAMNAATLPVRPGEPTTALFSVAEFVEMMPAFDLMDAWFELDQGVIVRMAPPNYPHVRTQRLLINALLASGAGATGRLVDKEIGIRIGNAVVRVVDVAVFDDPADEPHLVDGRLVQLAIEVSDSTLSYDLSVKSIDYATAGIADYWIIDTRARVVHLMSEPTPSGYATRTVAPFGQPMHAACLPEPVIFEG